jgi:hypothetical protein
MVTLLVDIPLVVEEPVVEDVLLVVPVLEDVEATALDVGSGPVTELEEELLVIVTDPDVLVDPLDE